MSLISSKRLRRVRMHKKSSAHSPNMHLEMVIDELLMVNGFTLNEAMSAVEVSSQAVLLLQRLSSWSR